jgi:hypothetical protein
VRLHGSHAEEEVVGDLGVGVPERDHAQDLDLTLGQIVGGLVLSRCKARPELGLQVGPALRGHPHRGHQLLVDGVLEDVALHPQLHGLARERGLGLHREHDDRGLRRCLEQLGDHAEAGAARHVEVEDQDIGLVGANVAGGVLGVAGLGDHLEALLRLEQQSQGSSDDGVVIGEHDPDLVGLGHRWKRNPMSGATGQLRRPGPTMAGAAPEAVL